MADSAARVDDGLLVNPRVSWPTMGLFALCIGGWAGTLGLALGGALPAWAAVPLLAVFAYVSFTPMHDGVHKSITRAAWMNDAIGRVAAVPLFAPFIAFRWCHLQHHRKTNHPTEDPDFWSGRGPGWVLPLRWLTQDLHYYVAYFGRWRSRPAAERAEAVGTLALFVAIAAGLAAAGWGREVVLYWLVPARLAIGWLAFTFDYLPHWPYAASAAEDRFVATRNLRWSPTREGRWLGPAMLWQNFHLVHHLYPGVPFHRYARVWRARRAELRAKGALTRPLVGSVG
ncbi:MAG: fatty acid desaturase [Myxococcales bacterium]|nr:fatty acid desaturase [Myxococcales bacterium]